MKDLPKRKHPRLKSYDYSEQGLYFITICVKNREKLLCKIVGRVGDVAPYAFSDTSYGFGL